MEEGMAFLFKWTEKGGGRKEKKKNSKKKKKSRIYLCNEGEHVLNLKSLFVYNTANMFHMYKLA